ncbi:DNA replication/repair protein RecF [Pueribacillus sp. YX66]|uniref:DNA replication/repair protein RecF n=1 Tax=Pueribacillus sp. YX66 TaxID=3229242 RepID=UPI00358CFF14
MHLQSISLLNYRNYKYADVAFDPNVNLLIGENAQGKTNMMEAIHTLAMTKGHRTQKDKELIRWDEKYARIEGTVEKNSGIITLEITISEFGKKAKLNSLEQRKLSNYIGALNIVMFAPEDLNIVKGNPSIRRRFLDMEIGQIQPVYIHDLSQYQKILQQRNALLKDLQRMRNQEQLIMLDILTESLTDLAAKVVKRRLSFLTKLQNWAETIHHNISHGEEELQLNYLPSVDVSEQATLSKIVEAYENKFAKIKDREIDRGMTLAGPHRDDVLFFVNGKDVQTFGSQGQQRTTALAVKLAEIELIKEEVGEYPILLLDDVLSELDEHRQSHLLNTIQGKVQTFVTTTSVDGIHHETLQKATRYHVSKGEIMKLE